MVKDDWERLIQFFVDQKVIPAVVPVDHVITNDFIDAINQYDRASIISGCEEGRSLKLQQPNTFAHHGSVVC